MPSEDSFKTRQRMNGFVLRNRTSLQQRGLFLESHTGIAIPQMVPVDLGTQAHTSREQRVRSRVSAEAPTRVPLHAPGRTNLVHPALPWVKIESATVEQDGFFEVLDVSKTACSSLDRHDLAVDPFGDSIRDPMCTEGDDVVDSFFQASG